MPCYKVLIVEDEEAIRNHIKKLIDWESMNFEIAGEADNGSQAIELIEKLDPHLVMLDIRLPSKSGLEVLKKTADRPIFFIAVTAFKDFDYAYSCLNYKVSSYLLKPIDKEELYSSVNAIKEKLDNITLSKIKSDAAQSQTTLSKKIIKSRFFEEMVFNKGIDINEADEKIKEYNIAFGQYVAVAVIEPMDNTYDEIHINVSEISFIDESAIDGLTILNVIYSADKNNIIVIVTSDRDYDQNYLSGSFSNFLRTINHKLDKHGISFAAGISDWHTNWVDIRNAWKEACVALSYKYLHDAEDKVLFFNKRIDKVEPTVKNPNQQYLMEHKLKEEVIRLLGNYDIDGAKQKFKEYFNLCVKLNTRREYNYKLIDFIIHIEAYATSKLITDDIENKKHAVNTLEISENIFSKVSIIDLQQYVNGVIDRILDNQIYYYTIPEIKQVVNYVEENYGGEISLNEVSRLVYMSPTYFSAFFKQKTGMTFSSFLTKFRVNKAKLLLKKNKYNVVEISQLVGYSSYRYFRNVFKELTGVTPNEFITKQ